MGATVGGAFGPQAAITGGTIGSLSALYGIVGAAGNADAISELTRDKAIKREEMLSAVEDFREGLVNSNIPVAQRQELVNAFIDNTYIEKEDGIYEKG